MEKLKEFKTIGIEEAVLKLSYFLRKGGPEQQEYEDLTQMWEMLARSIEKDSITTREEVRNLFNVDCLEQTMQGLAYLKPHGYPGDYEIIDKIYKEHVNTNPNYEKWDRYFHAQAAPTAVRNRKKYFLDLIKNKLIGIDRPLKVLNIASGPCRDVLEIFQEVGTDIVEVHCVEMDHNAIEYAKAILGETADKVKFEERNVFRFNTNEKYDLVWSAGLFDYFDDSVFVRLMKRFSSWCNQGGEIVIGNFSMNNPSRTYMELIGDWHLHHRSPEKLLDLSKLAGFEEKQVTVKSEVLGVNLFLHIKPV